MHRAPLLEREREFEAIKALVHDAMGGGGRPLIIEGPAGIGKPALLKHARDHAAGGGFRILTARAGELEHEFSFGVVRQLFEPVLAATQGRQREALLAGAAGLPRSLFEPEDGTTGDEPAERSFSILHGLYWLAANLAARGPLMIAIDDAHWADRASLGWINYLARRVEGLPLLLALTTRPPQQSQEQSFRTVL